MIHIGKPTKAYSLLETDCKSGVFGKDPSAVGVDTLKAAGFQKTPILKAIRAKCLDCCCQIQSEVRNCIITDCALWPYRMGKNPFSSHKGSRAWRGDAGS